MTLFPDLPADDPLAEPGCYDGKAQSWVRPQDYHRSARLSRSQIAILDPGMGTPAEFAWFREHPPRPTRGMIRGDAIHALVLEPERFEREYAFPPPGIDRRSKAGKEEWAAFLDEMAGRRIVGWDAEAGRLYREDALVVADIANAVSADPDLRPVLQSGGLTEPSYAWDETDEACYGENGITLRLRVRPDRVSFAAAGTALIDFKGTERGVGYDAWRRTIERNRLYFQAAMYLHGYEQATGERPEGFYHVVYSTRPPHLPAIYRLADEYIEAGLNEYRAALALLRRCVAADDWPGYAREIVTIIPSRWFGQD